MLLNHPFNDALEGATLVSLDDRRTFDLSVDTFIGRSRENDIVLIADLSLSRRHASITQVDGVYYLRDLRSSNGTLLNGISVEGMVALRPDDEIFLGRTRFLFCPSQAKLDAYESFAVAERTTILAKARPTTLAAAARNLMLNLKKAILPTEERSLKELHRVRASHTDELLRGIQR